MTYRMQLKKVKMFDDIKGSPNGILILGYHVNQIYKLPYDLAKVFVEELRVAEYLSDHQIEKKKTEEIDSHAVIKKLLKDKYGESKKLRDKFKSTIEKNGDIYKQLFHGLRGYSETYLKMRPLITNVNEGFRKFSEKSTKANKKELQIAIKDLLENFDKTYTFEVSFAEEIRKGTALLEALEKDAKSLEDNEEQVTEILSKIEKLI